MLKPILYFFLLGITFFNGVTLSYGNPRLGTLHENRPYIEPDTLIWSADLQLSWNDFRGIPNSQLPYAAQTTSGIKYQIEYFESYATLTLQAYFNRARSWVKLDSVNDQVLKHEYYHFCITELFARKLRKDMLKYKGNIQGLSPYLKKKFAVIYKDFVKYQFNYDQSTEHSAKVLVQKKWESKIDVDMRKYQKFSKESVYIYYD